MTICPRVWDESFPSLVCTKITQGARSSGIQANSYIVHTLWVQDSSVFSISVSVINFSYTYNIDQETYLRHSK